MNSDTIDKAAETLLENRTSPGLFQELPIEYRPQDLDEAYAVQAALAPLLTMHGWGAPAGFKIGCTTEVMQNFLGIDHPCCGNLFENTLHRSPARLSFQAFRQVGVECEIAVTLGRDLDGERVATDPDAISRSVSHVMAAIEVVDARYDDYATVSTPTLIADDFFSAAAIVGEGREFSAALDLSDIAGRMYVNEHEVGSGFGADILGDPLKALAWLAKEHTRRGRTLVAGTTILLGSVVQTQWLTPSADSEVVVEVDFTKLGRCHACFS